MIGSVLAWWTVSTLLGLSIFPISSRLFSRLADRGYGISRALGLLAAGYLLWIGASFGILRNNLLGAVIVVGLLLVAGFVSARRDWESIKNWFKQNLSVVITIEVLFLLAFAFWAFVRANTPEIQHTEKPMELAFLTSILKSETFPPKDPWLSDFAISYYYYGYILIAFLARLTGVLATEAFNLGNALWFALTAIGAYSILYSLFAMNGKRRLLAPLLGPLFILIAGNLEVVFDLLHHQHVFWDTAQGGTVATGPTPAFWTWLGLDDLSKPPSSAPTWIPDRFLWWWQSSRVIFDVRLDGSLIEMIDEFPFFSFLLADNHPHLLALPFVFIALTFTLSLFGYGHSGAYKLSNKYNQKIKRKHIIIAVIAFLVVLLFLTIATFFIRDLNTLEALNRLSGGILRAGVLAAVFTTLAFLVFGWIEVALPRREFWVAAWLFGALAFLNLTDFPIYLSFLFMIILWNQWKGLDLSMIKRLLATYIGLAAFAVLFYLPWYPSYGTQVSGILPNIIFPTRLHQFLIMFAPLFLPLFVWLIKIAAPSIRNLGRRLPIMIALGIPLALLLLSTILGALVYLTVSNDPGMLDSVLSGLGATGDTQGEAISLVLKQALWRRLTGSWTAILLGITLSLGISILVAFKLRKGEGLLQIKQSHLFVLFLIGTGALLVIGPDFLYVRDSFGHRMNTIFKFYYAAWVLWGIAAAYATVQLWPKSLDGKQLLQLLVLIPLVLSLLYPTLSLWTKTNGFKSEDGLTLDGLAYMKTSRPDEYAAIQWISTNLDEGVILEAIGGSYSGYGRISTHTGISTLLGWTYHEYQWRGDFSVQGSRESDTAVIYTTDNIDVAKALLQNYGIDYVYVGSLERTKYQPPDHPPINEEKFLDFMRVIYRVGDVTIFAVMEEGS
jgi:uncharacterized membrane protein